MIYDEIALQYDENDEFISWGKYKEIITTVQIRSDLKTIERNPFSGCTSLTNVVLGSNEHFKFEQGMILTKDGKELISYSHLNENGNSFIFLPDELTTIRENAFEGNDKLEMVVIHVQIRSSVQHVQQHLMNV